jgi:hypothetical protein
MSLLNHHAFLSEPPNLLLPICRALRQCNPTTGRDHPMPWQTGIVRRRLQRPRDLPRVSWKTSQIGHPPIGADSTGWDLFHHRPDAAIKF